MGNNYAFIDAQNLHVSLGRTGIAIDYKRFQIYLREKYGVSKIFTFIGYIEKNQNLYKYLEESGYILVYKKTTFRGKETKGNCDSDLIIGVIREWKNFNQAIIISGDGDFLPLIEYLQEHQKLLKIGVPTRKSKSALLNPLKKKIFYIENLREKLKKRRC